MTTRRVVAASGLLFIIALVGCGGAARGPGVPSTPDVSGPTAPCPAPAADCLAWDDFDRPGGPIVRATSGQSWSTYGLSCPGCHPTFETDGDRAAIAPVADDIFIWLATVDTGTGTGVEVSADITLSPTPRRANVGLVALFVDRMNHLTCKVEVTDGHPNGLLTIGEQRGGITTSLLAERDRVGLRSGETYRLEFVIPDLPSSEPLRCSVSGGTIERASVSHRLTAASLAAYGAGTGQGLRIKIFDDEDDGRSSWDDFVVAAA